jgi:hypothetical protein
MYVPFTSRGIRLFPLSSASVLNFKRNTKQCSYNSSVTGVSTSNLTHLYLLLVSSCISAGTALSNTNQAPAPLPLPPPTLTSHPTLHYFSNYYESTEPYILHKQFQYETRVSALTLTSSLLHTSGTTHILSLTFTVQYERRSLSGTGVSGISGMPTVWVAISARRNNMEQPLLLLHYIIPFQQF